MSQETVCKEFKVDTPASLTLANVRGSVAIAPGEGDVVTVTAVKHLNTGDPDHTTIRIEQKENGHVVIKTKFDGERRFVARQPCKVDYTVRVPHACAVKVRDVDSAISIQGLEGKVDVKTVSGKTRLGDLTGRVHAISVSGNVTCERISGPLAVESVSGDVSLAESDLPTVTGSSVSGDLVLQTALGEGPYTFKTVSGDVELILPPEAGCSLELRSMSGRIKTPLPTTQKRRKFGRSYAELQGGGPHICLNSLSGDLLVALSVVPTTS